MKKNRLIISFILIIFISISLFGTKKLYSQNDFYHSRVKINVGSSVVGNWVNKIDNQKSLIVQKSYSIPVIQASYDYKFEKWISIGIAGSYQYFDLDLFPFNTGSELIHSEIHRINIGIRPLFYYLNTSSVNLYSGLRFSMTFWQVNIQTTQLKEYITSLLPGFVGDYIMPRIPLKDNYSFLKSFFAMQLTIFGFEGYFTEHFGVNAELACGSPYFFSAGINFRF